MKIIRGKKEVRSFICLFIIFVSTYFLLEYNEENKKLLNAVSRLLQHNLSSYKEQIYCISCENFYSGRKALKNIVNELEFVLVEKMISNLQDKCK